MSEQDEELERAANQYKTKMRKEHEALGYEAPMYLDVASAFLAGAAWQAERDARLADAEAAAQREGIGHNLRQRFQLLAMRCEGGEAAAKVIAAAIRARVGGK